MFIRPSNSVSVLVRFTAFIAAGLIFILTLAAYNVEFHSFLHGHQADAACDDDFCIVDSFASGNVLFPSIDKVNYPPQTVEEDTGYAAVALLASTQEYLKKPGRDPPAAVVTY